MDISGLQKKIDYHALEVREKGYTVVKDALAPELTQLLLEKIRLLEKNLPPISKEATPYLNRGHRILYSLENKDLLFTRVMLGHPIARGLKMALLNDEWYKQIPQNMPNYILRAMIARSGGADALPLHIDSFIPSSGSYCWAMQVAFILEDQSEENGCAVIVPGSHLFDEYANQDALVDAVPIIPSRGDMVVWDSRAWHGARGNSTGQTRWSFIATFSRWWIKQNYDTVRNIPATIYDELSDEEKSVLGFCSAPPHDEYQRVDIKAGYEILDKKKE